MFSFDSTSTRRLVEDLVLKVYKSEKSYISKWRWCTGTTFQTWGGLKEIIKFCIDNANMFSVNLEYLDILIVADSLNDNANILSVNNLGILIVAHSLNNTGLISEAMDILREELRCAICQDIPLEACLTKCHHIYCSHCLKMCVELNNIPCPLCRTPLSISDHEALHMIDAIVSAVRSKHDSEYQSWARQEKLDRFCTFNAECLQRLYDSIIKSLKNFKPSNNDVKLVEVLSNLCQEFQSLLKALPCSEADMDSFREQKRELFAATKRIFKLLESLGY